MAPRLGPNQKPVGSSAETSQAKQPTEQEERANIVEKEIKGIQIEKEIISLQVT